MIVHIAVKVAGKMQKEVTDKRGQIDTLQTRIRWLEECLDAAIKVSIQAPYVSGCKLPS